jgi:hypothetical protein
MEENIMRVEYTNGQIVDVVVNIPQLQERMTQAERISVWGINSTQTIGEATNNLERGNIDADGNHVVPPVTVSSLVDLMVAGGFITSQRGQEFKA